ncbi:MAG: hypothetical protein PVH56_11875, partial [Desulfobacterales bacterium]
LNFSKNHTIVLFLSQRALVNAIMLGAKLINNKIYINTYGYNIFPNLVGTPSVGLQGSSGCLKSRLRKAVSFISLRRSAIILVISPFALRPL